MVIRSVKLRTNSSSTCRGGDTELSESQGIESQIRIEADYEFLAVTFAATEDIQMEV